MKYDIFGNEVNIGDCVAFNPPTYKGLVKGTVIKFTPKGFTVTYKHRNYDKTTTVFELVKKSTVSPPQVVSKDIQTIKDKV